MYFEIYMPRQVKQAVLDMKASLDKAEVVHQDQALRQATGGSLRQDYSVVTHVKTDTRSLYKRAGIFLLSQLP
jgi:hypothetical protein